VNDWIAIGHVRMRAIADFQGKARRYQFHTSSGETIDHQYLFETRIDEMDSAAATVADSIAANLSPHARRMCDDWSTGQLGEEARLERIREELVAEIKEVRRQRAEREKQRKVLEIAPDTQQR
jgi:hypothetical protein